MIQMLRRFFVILILILAALPALARGGSEATPGPDTGRPAQSVPAQAAPDDETASATTDPTVLDSQTTEVLFGLGVLPFKNRIPSENFVLKTLEGDDMSLEDYRGKVVFLNFWATWCGPCRDEMPSMQILYDALSEEGLEVVAVNVLEPEDLVSAFVEEFGFTYTVLLDRDGRVSLRYSIRAYPTTYILDRGGNVIGVRQGTLDWATPQMIDGFRELLAL
jgi:thiol-disulfide isomerase/thioredoxin